MFNFDSIIHLVGRHPDLAKDPTFNEWIQKHGGSIWHETHLDNKGFQTVIIYSTDRKQIFAALIQRNMNSKKSISFSEKILRMTSFDFLENPSLVTELAALQSINTLKKSSQYYIQASRPAVDFKTDIPTLYWEVEIVTATNIEKYKITSSDSVKKLDSFSLKKKSMVAKKKSQLNSLTVLSDDSREENELHHLSQYVALANAWTKGTGVIADKAFKIWLNVRQRMAYDLNIPLIKEFTWSDSLVIEQLGWRGICDEYAVIQITMLRALGISAVMKFLIWNNNGKGVGHACLEWLDGNTWRHMDALWNAFDDRTIYRKKGAQNVTVMDASFPRDSRSTIPAWGVPDPSGDLKLYPYGDYIISPGYPGNARPGYSY